MNTIKNFFLLLFILVLTSTMLFAQPKIQIDSANIDFGDVKYYISPVNRNIKIINAGTDTLKILNVKPSCGCTVAMISADNIAAGDTAEIGFEFDIRGFNGKTTKSITVTSNDPITPVTSILMTVNVIRPFVIAPKHISFDKVFVGEPATAEVKITNNSLTDAVIKNVTINNQEIVANINKNDIIKKGETFILKATAIVSKPGDLRSVIKIELEHPDERALDISTYGRAITKPNSE